MASLAAAPSVDLPNGKTNGAEKTDKVDKSIKSKPEKPDEEKYKQDLAKAEKEHTAAQEKLVCLLAAHCIYT